MHLQGLYSILAKIYIFVPYRCHLTDKVACIIYWLAEDALCDYTIIRWSLECKKSVTEISLFWEKWTQRFSITSSGRDYLKLMPFCDSSIIQSDKVTKIFHTCRKGANVSLSAKMQLRPSCAQWTKCDNNYSLDSFSVNIVTAQSHVV